MGRRSRKRNVPAAREESPTPTYEKAKEEGWRARSAYKLLQIDRRFHIFKDVTKAVDLCAAPGSWSQVLSQKLYIVDESTAPNARPKNNVKVNENVTIVAVDVQSMAAVPGVIQITADITDDTTANKIKEKFEGALADLVVSDGAPDVTGMHALDVFIQGQLVLAALYITFNILKSGGTFVAKIFRGKDTDLLEAQMQMLFKEVSIVKPTSSRNSSIEAFVVCKNYTPIKGFDPTKLSAYLGTKARDFSKLTGVNRVLLPFVVCGDASAYDSDATYWLNLEGERPYEYRQPVQPPIEPPYSKFQNLSLSDTRTSKRSIKPDKKTANTSDAAGPSTASADTTGKKQGVTPDEMKIMTFDFPFDTEGGVLRNSVNEFDYYIRKIGAIRRNPYTAPTASGDVDVGELKLRMKQFETYELFNKAMLAQEKASAQLVDDCREKAREHKADTKCTECLCYVNEK